MEGAIDEIVPEAEAGSRSFLVKVGLPREDGIYTGMFGRVRVPAGSRTRLVIPEAAVERVGRLVYVTTVGEGDVLARQLVTLGPAFDGHVEALSGLRAGDRVLVGAGVFAPGPLTRGARSGAVAMRPAGGENT